jgi:hypothetical protein
MTIFGQQLIHGLHIFYMHWKVMDEANTEAMNYIREHHKRFGQEVNS